MLQHPSYLLIKQTEYVHSQIFININSALNVRLNKYSLNADKNGSFLHVHVLKLQ
jgi:hypothetical protein